MNVLSLFGGLETGLIALKELGVKIDNYYSSEVDKFASAVARYNHPEIAELGSVSNYKDWGLPQVDLILAGPPCQGFSIAGKGLDWEDPRSKLFLTAIEILKMRRPKYFLFENVASMKKEIVKEIDTLMGIKSMTINSALVSAQNRKRNYWFNWDAEQPEDKGLFLKHIIETGYTDREKSHCLDANYFKGGNLKSYFEKHRRQLVFELKKKVNRISDVSINENGVRPHKGDYKKSGISELGRLLFESSNKTGTITATHAPKLLSSDFTFRKLTPLECERAQTLPDNYTQYGTINGKTVKISNTQRYKMIGNGWTKDIIKHLLSDICK